LFRPKAKGRADGITELTPTDMQVALSIEGAFDAFQVMSGLATKETTYTNVGEAPLLVQVADFADPEYYARWATDVVAYEDHGLGQNLSPGSPAKPWLPHLITRRNADGDALITAAELVAAPELREAERLDKPLLWICYEESEDLTKLHLVTGGVRFDTNRATVDLKATIEVVDGAEGAPPFPVSVQSLLQEHPERVRLYLTVATQLELPQTVLSDPGQQYLPEPRIQTIRKPDLVPERRESVRLPKLDGTPLETIVAAESGEELYVDVTSNLEDALDSAIEFNPELQRPITLTFALVPDIDIGDRISFSGRPTGATGNEVVTEVSFKFADGVPDAVVVKATNVPSAVSPERFLEPE
jgi:hypothetical protein